MEMLDGKAMAVVSHVLGASSRASRGTEVLEGDLVGESGISARGSLARGGGDVGDTAARNVAMSLIQIAEATAAGSCHARIGRELW